MSIRGAVYLMGIGAGLMYYLDPERGRVRRSLLEDNLGRAGRDLEVGLERAYRDLANRASGVFHELSHVGSGETVSDEVLSERIRSKIGRLVEHPRSVAVSTNGGSVVLTGPVFSDEVQRLVHGVRRIRGVRHVANQLEVHDRDTENVPGLQGSASHPVKSSTPGERLLTGGIGTSLLLTALTRGGLQGLVYAVAGVSLLSRSVKERGPTEAVSHRRNEEERGPRLPH